MTDKDHGQSNDSIPSKDASNNNISFLSRGKTTNGKNSSYVVLECFGEDENKIDGNLEAIL